MLAALVVILAQVMPGNTHGVEVFHPGHRAELVMRLHRYDHSGMEAMHEEEDKWHRKEFQARSHFLQVSPQQAFALQEHHKLAMEELTGRPNASSLLQERLAPQLRRARRHLQYHDQQGIVKENAPAVTGMSNLDSQYVGPLGAGTALAPKGCTSPGGQSLVYVQTLYGEEGSSIHQDTTCHVVDQSIVWVVFDTGSTNMWVSSDLCKNGPCTRRGRNRYDHTLSTTYADPEHGVFLNIEFGTGRISGPQAVDDFHVGPFTVYSQTFGMIQKQEGKVFEEVPFEGILGLAFPQMSANGVTPFFDNIIDQKALQKNEFAFYFSPNNPAANAVFWGGVDPKFYTGKIEYFNVVDPFYWSTVLESFKIGGEELLGLVKPRRVKKNGFAFLQTKKPKVVFDSGTTFFTAEDGLFEKVMERLPAANCDDITADSHPSIVYRLRNTAGELRDFELTSEQYMIASAKDGPSRCSPAFMRINIPTEHGPGMVLGEVFMRHFYSVFDRGNGHPASARIGLAKARHGEHVNKHLSELTKNQARFEGMRGLDDNRKAAKEASDSWFGT